MAKSTPARKRKATDDDIDESSEEEDDSSSSSSSDSEKMSEGNSDDENNDNMDEDSDNDTDLEPSTTKTPANKHTTASKKNKTPNSSGMKMRSGRKKKRKKSISPKNSSTLGAPSTTKKKRGTTTNPRKRAKKSTADDDDNDDDEDSVLANGGKRNGKKAASKLVNDNSSEEEEETHTKKKKKGNRRKSVGFDATTKKGSSGSSRRAAIDENATIRKVPHAHEQTREAVAAAQMSQSPTISEEAAANNSSSSSNNGGIMGGGGLLHLVSQTLRLPSQHTPAKPSSQQQQDDSDDNLDSDAAESLAPPLAGGRRLIFATTAKKKKAGGGRTTGGRNKLLLQTREKQQQQREKISSKKQTRTTTSDSTPESNNNDNQEEPSSLLVQLTNEWEENGEEYKKDIALYTKGWFFVLFLCFIVGNIANMSLFNVRSQSIELSKLYGIESKITDTVLETTDDNNNGEGATTTTPEIVTITQPDPDLIANARATYRAERMNTHDISKIDKSMEEMNEMMKVVDDTMTSWMKDYPNVAFGETKDGDEQQKKDESVNKISASIIEKQNVLLEWEWALVALEEAMDAFTNGDISPEEVNKAMDELTKVSMMKSEAALLDMSKISVPGEGCEGMDYNAIPTKHVKSNSQVGKEDTIEVVGGIDVDALNIASDSPILIEDAKNVYQSLVTLAQSTSEALIGPSGASSHAKQWLEQVIAEELHKRGVDEHPPLIDEATILSSSSKSSPSNTDGVYTFNDAVTDIDRLLEIEDADRTGKFDYASIVNGAQVVRRGPYSTSYSLYETLPLVNRVLAYTKLRFYGHPPEAALVPTFPMHTRGQCWSFTNEQSSSRTRRQAGGGSSGDMIGDYATLTISLPSAISVSEVLVEHIPPTITSDPTSSAMKEFRVLGFEDTGAFGEPWELGLFVFNDVGPSIQRFAIPTTLDGQNVPKLNSIAFAVDTNWGGDYTCLYRVRVHQ